eukprot:TRINITY_DN3710_c0_g1_i2.p1 TRINITY_DN3710_c0_g1~~TRINITY_DN3710_c0_g1_i2.p1  ORF type:complete len:397 (+),score=70.93 TRINITY_DN3710_c0_g1_i2:103-1293(+)
MPLPKELAPALSPEQKAAANQDYEVVPKVCCVTGSSGFVGQRLVEMLIERGAEEVRAFDIIPAREGWPHPSIKYIKGDLRNYSEVEAAVKGCDCVWHIGAAVGPFHPKQLYDDVNYKGTIHVIDACKSSGVKKLVFSSSPSTRFNGDDVDGGTEDDLPPLPQKSYLQEYARTKAMGELEVTKAAKDGSLLAVSVAPHQVYGPRDTLFLTNILESAGSGQLRVFGKGDNRICFSHVDNYCHGLIIAEKTLYKGSKTLGKFYICTDGATHPHSEGYAIFWKELDVAVTAMGFTSLFSKMHLPVLLMTVLAYICSFIGFISGKKMKLTPFTVRMLTMHRWFSVENAEADLKFKPIIPFSRGWEDTITWFKSNWLPQYDSRASGYGNVAKITRDKIDRQR